MEHTVATKKISLENLSHPELLSKIQAFLEEYIGTTDSVEIRLTENERSVLDSEKMDDPTARVVF